MNSWSIFRRGKRELHTRSKVKFLPLLLIAAMVSGMLMTSSVGAEGSSTDSPDQVVNSGASIYYRADGTVGDINDYAAKVTKKVSQRLDGSNNPLENQFRVNLEVETVTNYTSVPASQDTSVVIVIDLSYSMDTECAECGKKANNHSSGEHDFRSRSDVSEKVLKEFLVRYAADANGAQRNLCIVGYATNTYDAFTWGNIASYNDSQIDTIVRNTMDQVGSFAIGQNTSTGAAMKRAKEFLGKAPAGTQTSVILMTDGLPNEFVGDSSFQSAIAEIPGEYKNTYDALIAYCAANGANLWDFANEPNKNNYPYIAAYGLQMRGMGASLYTISFASGSVMCMNGKQYSSQYLAEYMKLFADVGYDAGSADKLSVAFTQIIKKMTETRPNTVADELPANFVFDKFINAPVGHATVKDGIVLWDLAGLTPVESDSPYTYTLSYYMTLDNTKTSYLTETVTHNVNDTAPIFTFLMYEDGVAKGAIRRVRFDIPTVRSYAGEISFQKVDPKGNPVLKQEPEASVFALYLDPAAAPVATATNQGKGVITFQNVPSGHDYVMKETKAPDGMVADKDAAWTASVAWGLGTVKDTQGQAVTAITNYYDPQETTVTVRKVWNDATNNYLSQTVSYTLTAHPSNKTIEGTLSSADAASPGSKTWEGTITVPTRDKNTGAEQYYTISEAPITGYTPTYSSVGSDTFIIVNDLATRSLKVTKTWEDPEDFEGVHPTVTVLVYAGEGDNIVARTVMQHNLVTGKSEAVIYGLPVIDKDGQEIQYRVGEEMEYADSADDKYLLTSDSGTMEDGYTLVNTNLKCETRSASLHIHWYGDGTTPEKRPESLVVHLQQSTDNGATWVEAPNTEVTLSASTFVGKDIWSHEYTGLPMYVESTDTEILYRASREDGHCAGYGTTYSDNLVDINNTLELTSVTVRKVWAKPSALPTPDAIFELYRSVQGGAEALVKTYTMPPSETEHTFSDLPRTDGTNAYTYTVKEVAPDDYESIKDPNSPSFTNRIKNKSDVTVQGKINWELRGEQGDILPEEVTVQLWANGAPAVNPDTGKAATAVANKGNGWTFEFKNALRYRLDGYGVVEYSVRELDKDGNPAPDASTILFRVGGEEKDFGAHYIPPVDKNGDGSLIICDIRNHTNKEIREYVSRIDRVYTHYQDGVEDSTKTEQGEPDVRNDGYDLTFDTSGSAYTSYENKTYSFVSGTVTIGAARAEMPKVVPGENTIKIDQPDGAFIVTLQYELRETTPSNPPKPPKPTEPTDPTDPTTPPTTEPTPPPTTDPTTPPTEPTLQPSPTPNPDRPPDVRPNPPVLTPEEDKKVDEVIKDVTEHPDHIIKDKDSFEEMFPEITIEDLPPPLYWGPEFAVVEVPVYEEIVAIDSELVPLGSLPQTGSDMRTVAARIALMGMAAMVTAGTAALGGWLVLRRKRTGE